MGNPISFIDPLGLKAGDVFNTIDDALKDAYTNYYGITDYTKLEIGGALYSYSNEDGMTYYLYTEPIVGEPENINFRGIKETIPMNGFFLGYYHTHPSLNEEMDKMAESFSALDFSCTFGWVDVYLMTRLGNIYKLSGRSNPLANVNINNEYDKIKDTEGKIPIQKNLSYNKIEDENVKNEYALKYGEIWIKHLAKSSKAELNIYIWGFQIRNSHMLLKLILIQFAN